MLTCMCVYECVHNINNILRSRSIIIYAMKFPTRILLLCSAILLYAHTYTHLNIIVMHTHTHEYDCYASHLHR